MKPVQPRYDHWEIVRKLSLFGVASLVLGIGGFRLLMWAFPFFSRAYFGNVAWDRLGEFVSVVSLVLVTAGLAFALAEYTDKENAKRRERAKLSYDIYQAIFEKLTAPDYEAARRWILANIPVKKPEEEISAWYKETQARIMGRPPGTEEVGGLPEGQTSVKLTLNCFDYIGFIANHYWDVDDDSLDWISPPIAKVWKRIGPYVQHIRTLRKARDYYLSAEYIGNRCIEWRQSRGLPDEEYATQTL
jgi:hypothetical protein